MSPFSSKIPVLFGPKSPMRSVRIFKITTEITSPNIIPFLKYAREIVDTDDVFDTDHDEWKSNWMSDLVHNTLKYIHKIR